jgi:hypothetical protein
MNTAFLLAPLVCLSGGGHAATPTIDQALAFRGGALVIPLTNVSGDAQSIAASLVDSGRTVAHLDAHLMWIGSETRFHRPWSLPPQAVRVSSREARDSAPFAVVSLPPDGRGHLVVDTVPVALHWADLPESMPASLRHAHAAAPTAPHAAPPLQDPLEAWRCELIAAHNGDAAPSLDRFEDSTIRLIALAAIGPWRLAMHRLASADLGVARHTVDMLTGTTRNEDVTIAAWLCSSSALDELLAIAMSPNTKDDPIAGRALRWCERQTRLLAWITADRGESVVLSLANPEPKAVLAEVAWATPGELPLASSVPAGESTMVRIDPLPLRALTPLLLEVGQNHMTLPINRSAQDVEPPGLMLGPLYPNRTLVDVHAGSPPPPAPMNRQTFAQFRKLMGHWEIMLECRWPTRPSGPSDGESVTVELRGERTHIIEVTPNGLRSTHQPSGPRVHVNALDHAWLCRVVLPDAWVVDHMSIALLRTHGDSQAFETWPTPCVPWRIEFDPTPLNLSAWDQDVPTAAP